jgi:predicted amidohydrolase
MPWTPPSASARVVWPTMDDLRAVPSAPLTVAAGQAACTALDISANVAAAAGLVRRAADQGAALLVLPELFLPGYELPAILADPQTYTLSPADLRLDPLATACAQTRTAVVVGAPTRDPQSGGLHISALVLGRDGRFAVQYDKQHVDPAERAAGFSPGASGCTLTLDGWRLGLGICWDSSYPEHARAAALDGCHAYLVGAMFGRGRGAHRRATVCPARALDNASYVVVANHSGPSGPYHGGGRSAVWNPDGTLLVDADTADPGLATARLDPEVLARARAEDLVLVGALTQRPGPPLQRRPPRLRRPKREPWTTARARRRPPRQSEPLRRALPSNVQVGVRAVVLPATTGWCPISSSITRAGMPPSSSHVAEGSSAAGGSHGRARLLRSAHADLRAVWRG